MGTTRKTLGVFRYRRTSRQPMLVTFRPMALQCDSQWFGMNRLSTQYCEAGARSASRGTNILDGQMHDDRRVSRKTWIVASQYSGLQKHREIRRVNDSCTTRQSGAAMLQMASCGRSRSQYCIDTDSQTISRMPCRRPNQANMGTSASAGQRVPKVLRKPVLSLPFQSCLAAFSHLHVALVTAAFGEKGPEALRTCKRIIFKERWQFSESCGACSPA